MVTSTRYGNVMYSRGSVIPLFVEQIRAGKPLTVTDPGATRFLMSLEESVELVSYAFDHADAGDLFVRKARHAPSPILPPPSHGSWAWNRPAGDRQPSR